MAYGTPPTQNSYRNAPYPPPGGSPYGGFPMAQATDGVLSKRLFAYLVDLVVIAVLVGLISVVIAILGVLTLGLGWLLFGLVPLTAFVYNAITIGGPGQSTLGMRMMGLRVVDATTGGRVGAIAAAVHALLFYLAAGTVALWVLDIGLGLVRSDRRLGHDLLVNFLLVRAR